MVDGFLTSDAHYHARFPDEARRAVYDALALRRDVRHFDPSQPIDDATLERILAAAHLAPSVGFSQPWAFIVVDDRAVRARIRESFLACRALEAARFPEGRRAAYLATRLEGILDAPVNVCVAVDLRPRPEAILGTTVQPEAVRASATCAVQNMWLAARVEGVGIGWVSIVEPSVLRAELALPAGVEPIAYLCVGRPLAFRARPMLEENGWLPRRPLSEVVHRGSRFSDAHAPAPAPPARSAPAPATPSAVPPFDAAAAARATAHHALLTKPVASLGRLEELAIWLAGVRGTFPVGVPTRGALLLFAADHGVTREGVSAYGSDVTAAMVANVMAGGAAVSVLAQRYDVDVTLVDVGVTGDLSRVPRTPPTALVRAPVRPGTGNVRREVAMTVDEAHAAMGVGAATAREAIRKGADAILVGEIGIGNTTAGALLTCAFTGARAGDIVGRGTGLDDDGVAHKTQVVRDALDHHAQVVASGDPVAILAAVGGLELAAIAGAILEAARHRRPVVLDGFLTTAAALVAHALDAESARYTLASHASAERGHARALAHLGLRPLLDLGLRLGEGTGAVLALDLLRTAVTVQRTMATFATSGVVGRAGADLPEPQPVERPT